LVEEEEIAQTNDVFQAEEEVNMEFELKKAYTTGFDRHYIYFYRPFESNISKAFFAPNIMSLTLTMPLLPFFLISNE